MFTFAGLDARFLVGRNDRYALFMPGERLEVELTDAFDFSVEGLRVCVAVVVEPITHQMWLQGRLVQDTSHVTRRNSRYDLPFKQLVRQLATGPMTDLPVCLARIFASSRDDLDKLFWGEGGGSPWAGRVRQRRRNFSGKLLLVAAGGLGNY